MEIQVQCSKETEKDGDSLDDDSSDNRETLLPGLPDYLAQRCLTFLSPSLLFSVCHPWRRFLYSPFFPPFFSLYALLSPSRNPAAGDLSSHNRNTIEFFSFDPPSSAWRHLPNPPQNQPLHLLHHHPSFLSRKLPIQSLVANNHLILMAATTHHDHKFSPALSRPLLFHPDSNSWFYGPHVSTPRRWCATGAAGGVVYLASGVGVHYSKDVAKSMEQWDVSRKRESWIWEKRAQLRDGRFSREAVEAVGYKGKLCMVNVKGNAVKEGAVYDVVSDAWEEMPQGMVSGWNGPAASNAEEDAIYVIDEMTGSLSKYNGEKDCWVKLAEMERLKRAEQMAVGRGKICVVSANGERIIVVDAGGGGAAVRFWEVPPPPGLEVVAVHVLPRMSRQASQN